RIADRGGGPGGRLHGHRDQRSRVARQPGLRDPVVPGAVPARRRHGRTARQGRRDRQDHLEDRLASPSKETEPLPSPQGLEPSPLPSIESPAIRNRESDMAARAYWKGQIRLALVSIPVEVYSATKSGATVAFNQIHEPTGKRIKYEKVVPGVGPVNPDEIVKGYQYEKGSYVLLDDEELEGVRLESKKTLDLTQFVEAAEIDMIYFDKPYYVVPADDLAEEAYIVLREALERTGKVGLGQLAMRG